ncbi:hypothetical protein Tco_0734293, partial [Tanacetum coccineum]
KMAEGNIPAPTRTDDQLVPVKAHLPIRKSNFLMDLQTNALGITPKDPGHPFVAPPAGDLVIDFVNNLGYPKELQFVSKMYINSLYQPWRSSLTMINQCLTGKTLGYDRPRHPVIQMLWGVVTGTNVDYAELIWEEFVQAIKSFFSDAASLKVPSKKPKPHVIPYCRFTKLIICYLGERHNIHKRPQSPLHITADDYALGNLKFVHKGELDEVFDMDIPKYLLTDAICNAEYYHKYLEMAAHKPRQPSTVTDEESVKKKTVPPADKSKKPIPAKQTKLVKENSTKPTPSKKDSKGKVIKVRKGKRGIQMSLESFQTPINGVAIREPSLGVTQSLPVVEGKGKGIATDEQTALSLLDLHKPKKKSTTDQYIFQRRTPVTEKASTGPSAVPQDDTSTNVVLDTPSPAYAETGADTDESNSGSDTEILDVTEEQGEDVSHTVALEERIVELDEG